MVAHCHAICSMLMDGAQAFPRTLALIEVACYTMAYTSMSARLVMTFHGLCSVDVMHWVVLGARARGQSTPVHP